MDETRAVCFVVYCWERSYFDGIKDISFSSQGLVSSLRRIALKNDSALL